MRAGWDLGRNYLIKKSIMTPEEIQQVWETKIHCDIPLKGSYAETDGHGFVTAICEGCFTKFKKSTEIVDLDVIHSS